MPRERKNAKGNMERGEIKNVKEAKNGDGEMGGGKRQRTAREKRGVERDKEHRERNGGWG